MQCEGGFGTIRLDTKMQQSWGEGGFGTIILDTKNATKLGSFSHEFFVFIFIFSIYFFLFWFRPLF